MPSYKEYLAQQQAYTRAKQAADPAYQQWLRDSQVFNTPDLYGQGPAWTGTNYNREWLDSLTPQQQAQYEQGRQDSKSWSDPIGQAAKAIPFAVGGLGLAGAAGLLGGASGLSAGGAGGLGGLDAAMLDMGAGAMSGAGAVGGGSSMSGLLSGLGNVGNWGSLLSGGAGLINSFKSPAQATAPDYSALAREQAYLEQMSADRALSANRPNQIDAAGNSLSWAQDPTTGRWTQTQKLSGQNQAILDQSQQAQLDALRGVSNRGEFDPQGLQSMMDPVGNSADIQNAWMNLLDPARERARAGEVQRLKNQGLTEDSPAFQRAMQRLDEGDTDAQNKALIYGTQEYGNQFGRSLQNRQQGFGEYQTEYQAPMQQYQGLMGIAAPSGNFGSFTNTQSPGAPNIYGAGQDQYAANLGNANAKNAASNNTTQGLFGLAGSIAKGGWGA